MFLVVTKGGMMRADERYAEAERIALRMGFHRAFVQAEALQGEAAGLARARAVRPAPTRGGRPWSAWLALRIGSGRLWHRP
jgi:hypothetical protein